MAVEDRCIFLSVFLRTDSLHNFRDSALSISVEILFGKRHNFENKEIEALFCESVLAAIHASRRIHRKYAQSILANVVDNFGQFEVLESREEKVAMARPILLILEALVDHSDAASELYVAETLEQIGAEKRAMFVRLGVFAREPFLSVLKRIPGMAATTMHVLVHMETNIIRRYPDVYFPILSFLASCPERSKFGMTCDMLTKIAVGGLWNVDEVDIVHLDFQRSVLKTAFDFGANITVRQSTDKVMEALFENGPSRESGPAAIWWAIACGLLSNKDACDRTENGARNLLKLIVQQLTNNEELVVPRIYCGPLHAVKQLLTLAPPSKGHGKPHTEEYEDAKQLYIFVQTAFKTFGIPLLRSASEDGFLSQESGVSHHEIDILRDLAVILECVEQATGGQELAVNLNRLVLHYFGEFSKCFASIGDRSRIRTIAEQAACCSVLHSFARIVGSACRYLHMIGIDARSAVALTKIEQVLCSASFAFFASTSVFDRDVIAAMAAMRSCLKKNDFRRMKGFLDHRQRFFAPLAANIVPILEAERLRATCTYIMEQHQSCESGKRKAEIFFSDRDISTMPYEPRFVLRVLRLGAGYAVSCHNSAVLDLGLVANDGVYKAAADQYF